jgi:hypothetical protein
MNENMQIIVGGVPQTAQILGFPLSGIPLTGGILWFNGSAWAPNNNMPVNSSGKFTGYGGVNTSGNGVIPVFGSGHAYAQTGAVTTVASYATGGANGEYWVSANVNVTTYSAGTFTVTCAYTDENSTPRTLTFNFSTTAGVLGTAIAAAGAFEGLVMHIKAAASTSITIATTGTFTSLTYDVSAVIAQPA